jgi:signal transduction histidine kinase
VIYRIFQEAINNILKHAGASQINIAIETQPYFKLTVTDDGRGFDHDLKEANGTSLGLQNMITRAEMIDYTVNIKSAPGNGTTLTLTSKTA